MKKIPKTPDAPKLSIRQRLRLISPYLAQHKAAIIGGWIFVVLSTGLDQVGPYLVKRVLDNLENGVAFPYSVAPLGFLVGSTLISGFMLYFQRLWVIKASRSMEYSLRRDLFSKLLVQPKSFFDKHPVGGLMSMATNDLDRIRDVLGPVVLHLARMGCLLLYTGLAIYFLHPKLLLYGLLPAVVMPILANIFLKRMYALFGAIQKSLSEMNGFVQDTLNGIQVVKGFGREDRFTKKFETASKELRQNGMKVAVSVSALWPVVGVLGSIGVLLTVFLGGRLVIAHEISIGTLSAAILYLLRLQFPLIGLGWVFSMIQRANASMDRLAKLQGEFENRPLESGLGKTPPPVSLEVKNLHFAYNHGSNVLEGIHFVLPPGKSLGVVGPVGAGKTTLIQVLSGIYSPSKDSVSLGGNSFESSDLSFWRSHFSYAPQDGFLFSRTIRDNIAFGKPDSVVEGEVEQAADWAGLSRDLGHFPQGYDSWLGEKGINLSGGQRQRVGLARALLCPSPILCLDDTLSALDAETETIVLDTLRQRMKNRCLIIVAHRYSAVAHCDEIIYLENGRILERGSHAELLALGGRYSQVWERQKLSSILETT